MQDHYSEDNEILVVDTSHDTNNVLDNLKWWKAVDPGPFKMGSARFHSDVTTESSQIPKIEENVAFSASEATKNAMPVVVPKYYQEVMASMNSTNV